MSVPEHFPHAIKTALEHLVAEPSRAPSTALLVFGSLVRGDHQQGDPVSVCVVLREATAATLAELSAPFKAAFRAARIDPLFLTEPEIPLMTDAFPIKALQIRDQAILILGAKNPFDAVSVSPGHLRLRLEQQARNHLMRLRRRIVFTKDDPRALAAGLLRTANTLPEELETLLHLRDSGSISFRDDPDYQQVLRTAAAKFELPVETIEQLQAFRRGDKPEDVWPLYRNTLSLLERLTEVVDREFRELSS